MKRPAPWTPVYEDPRILAVNKQAGINVGADRWDGEAERLDRLLALPYGRIFTVHRIDKDTSGLVVFARNAEIHRFLSQAFESRAVEKTYLAAVHGRPAWEEADCDLPLVPDGDRRRRTIVDRSRGKKSYTRFRRLLCAGNYSLIEARPETGRTHQIRVHLAALGYPVICDPLYGVNARSSTPEGGANRGGLEKGVFLSSFKKGWRGSPADEKPLISRLALHALRLVLPLPDQTAEPALPSAPGILTLDAPLPRDFSALRAQMEKSAAGSTSPP
jgi:23S rRNA pseudouridine1911/1915/1917 synthase